MAKKLILEDPDDSQTPDGGAFSFADGHITFAVYDKGGVGGFAGIDAPHDGLLWHLWELQQAEENGDPAPDYIDSEVRHWGVPVFPNLAQDAESSLVGYRGSRNVIQGRAWLTDGLGSSVKAISFWNSKPQVARFLPDLAKTLAPFCKPPDAKTWWEFNGLKPVRNPFAAETPKPARAQKMDLAKQHALPPGHKDKVKRDVGAETPRQLGGFPTMAQRNFHARIGDSQSPGEGKLLLEDPDVISTPIGTWDYGGDDGEGIACAVFMGEEGSWGTPSWGALGLAKGMTHSDLVEDLYADEEDADGADGDDIRLVGSSIYVIGRPALPEDTEEVRSSMPQARVWYMDEGQWPRCLAVSWWCDENVAMAGEYMLLELMKEARIPMPDENTWWEYDGVEPHRKGGKKEAAPRMDHSKQHALPPGHKDKVKREVPAPNARQLGGYPDMAQRNYHARIGDSLQESPDRLSFHDAEKNVTVHLNYGGAGAPGRGAFMVTARGAALCPGTNHWGMVYELAEEAKATANSENWSEEQWDKYHEERDYSETQVQGAEDPREFFLNPELPGFDSEMGFADPAEMRGEDGTPVQGRIWWDSNGIVGISFWATMEQVTVVKSGLRHLWMIEDLPDRPDESTIWEFNKQEPFQAEDPWDVPAEPQAAPEMDLATKHTMDPIEKHKLKLQDPDQSTPVGKYATVKPEDVMRFRAARTIGDSLALRHLDFLFEDEEDEDEEVTPDTPMITVQGGSRHGLTVPARLYRRWQQKSIRDGRGNKWVTKKMVRWHSKRAAATGDH